MEVGITSSVISRRVKNGTWSRPLPGVYLVAGAPATWQRAVSIAVLGSGEGAVASHATSAYFWGLTKRPRIIEVTTPQIWRPVRDHVIHRSTDLIAEDIVEVDGTFIESLVEGATEWDRCARC